MVTTTTPAPEAPVPISPIGRIAGALFNPKPTFADIARRPSWIAPLLLMVVLGTAIGAMLNTKMNWADYIRHQADKNSRFEQLSEEQKESTLRPQVKYASYFSYAIGVLNVPIGVLFFALIYWGAFNLFTGAGLGYKTAFGITAHAFLPLAIQSVLAIVILAMKSYGDVDPENLVATNVGAFLSEEAPKWLISLGRSLDLFWFWFYALAAIGFSAANPKKIKLTSAYGTIFGIWFVYILAKVAWAAL